MKISPDILKKILFLLTIFCLLPVAFIKAEKLALDKLNPEKQKEYLSEKFERRSHPFEHHFRQTTTPKSRFGPNNRLLVILVDFQESDDTTFTGNGKFITEKDENNVWANLEVYYPESLGFTNGIYPISLSSPPYDREYFESVLEAMKYYYLAVSYEAFHLEYDVYPKNKQAYTLSQKMSYYNPGLNDYSFFVQRIEEFFKEAWETADTDTDRPAYFSDYDHFMIIHAGIDWQNSMKYQDIPSLFINIEPGKEAIVDGGFQIHNSAVVPEHLTGRIRHYEEDGIVTGFGALNAVFAHEFGHSLGFADLYNTFNSYPGVGVFDIMDSGGMGSVVLGSNGLGYVVSGALPALPSAWTRLLAFEQDFLERGILVDIDAITPQQEMQILASSDLEVTAGNIPAFYRLKLSEYEYILIENRNIDPDGDGGTAMKGTEDRRVILHPEPYDYEYRTYEYDWLLPSWVDRYGDYHGSGILIWHIDDHRIYHEGLIQNGQFVSNYDLNRVNVQYEGKKGVRLLEADGLFMIGNPSMYIWSGTPFDYYFRYAPVLDDDGFFTGWNPDRYHNIELSSRTQPPLRTYAGNPSNWKVYDFSQADRIMSFKVSNSLFDYVSHLGKFSSLYDLGSEASIRESSIIATLSDESLNLYWCDNDFIWRDFEGDDNGFIKEIHEKPDFDIITVDLKNDGSSEYLLVFEDKILMQGYDFAVEWVLADKVIETPLFFTHNQTNYIGLAFADNSCIYKVNDSYGLEQIQSFNYGKGKLAFAKETVYFQAVRKLYKMSMKSAEIEVVSLPDIHTKYDPVIYTTLEKELVFMMSDTHKIYRLNDEKVDLIFNLNLFTPEIPSHLAIGYTADFMSCFIVFHTETQIFALSEDGAFLPGFPVRLEKNKLDVASYPYIFRFDGTPLFTLYDTNQGLLSVDINGKIRYEYSHYWAKSDVSPRFFITDIMGEKTLNMVYSDTDNNAYIGTKTLENPSENEILWNGYRNGSTGVLHRAEILIQPDNEKVRVYVYPNPVKSQTGTVRITNSYATAKVRVYNTAGQVVISDTINESIESFRDFRFDTQNLSSGVYFTVVEIEGKTYNEKFAVIK